MSVFSGAELAYLASGKLGRLATIDGAGMPHADAAGPDGKPAGPIIRLHPTEVISWGMEFAGE